MHSHETRARRTLGSALWAAVGDAVGFPTELTSDRGVRSRLGGHPVGSLRPWKRRVGGRFGVEVLLPEGAYSDDTQLRLCTSRCITSRGFDVESFSKVELPVWLSYALGAGKGSKAAATSLISNGVAWFSNFFDNRDGRYVNGGGNGAAMRIQPHVWAARNLDDTRTILQDVVRNSLTTHGHMRGVIGAMLHAMHVAHAIKYGECPHISSWEDGGVRVSELLMETIASDQHLNEFWRPTWEKSAGRSISDAIREVEDEWRVACSVARSINRTQGGLIHRYRSLLDKLGGYDAAERGSGLKCTMYALSAATWADSDKPLAEIATVAAELGTDTDTIASMMGAILGAITSEEAPKSIQDRDYIEREAYRLYMVSLGLSDEDFIYPDLLFWQPPKSGSDTVTCSEGVTALHGLGVAQEIGDPVFLPGKDIAYRWFSMWFGQTVLCRHRWSGLEGDVSRKSPGPTFELAPQEESRQPVVLVSEKIDDIDALSDMIIRSGFDAGKFGSALLALVNDEMAIEKAISLTAIVVKAKKARDRKIRP